MHGDRWQGRKGTRGLTTDSCLVGEHGAATRIVRNRRGNDAGIAAGTCFEARDISTST